jgi:ATP-dependent DNA helicase DinG
MSVVRIDIPSKHPLPDMWESIRPHFPMPSPRKYQDDALSVAYWAMENDDFDNIVIEAPTGIGKSAIAMTVQNRFMSAYLLTPTLGLTDQYRRDYGHLLKEIKGRRNFPCWVRSGTADGAPCYVGKKRCPHTKEDDPCGYYAQKFAARDARIVLSNPAYLFRVIKSPDGTFDQRDFAIIDEAHQLEQFFMGLYEIQITNRDFNNVFGPTTFPMHYHPADWKDPIKELHDGAIKSLSAAERDEDERGMEQFRAILNKTTPALELLDNPANCVVEQQSDRRGSILTIRPVRVRSLAPDLLDSISRKRIMLSATILDIDTYLDGLGLKDQKTLFIRITQSPFPLENINIHYAPTGSMSYSRREKSIPRQARAIAGIMDKWPDKRGVVLPHTHAIRKALVQELTDLGYGDRIITHDTNGPARKIALDRFFESEREDLVLISTYVSEGFDFKGKLAEWLVISKVPYLFTPDPQIKQRMEEDEHEWRREHEGTPACPYEPPSKYTGNLCGSFTCPKPCAKWFNVQTALRLVQGAGRINRTPEDVGHLFILDQSWERFYRMNGHLLPAWFRSAIKPTPNWMKRHLS